MPTLEIKPLPTQRKAIEDKVHPWIMYGGGLGSGKSFLLALMTGELSWQNSRRAGAEKDWAGIVMAPSHPEFKRDVLPLMLDLYGDMKGFRYMENHKEHGKHFLFPWNSKPVYIVSAETRLKGPNVGYALLNEHSSIPFERVQQTIQRVRGVGIPSPRIWFCGTPEDDYGWLEDFVTKHTESGKLGVYTAPTTENEANLGPDYVNNLKESLDPKAYRLYVLGEMIRLGGEYFYYAYDPKVNDWDDAEYDKDETVHVSIDFNVGRMTATCWHIYGAGFGKQAVAFDQIELKDHGSNTRDMGRAIQARYGLNCVLTLDSAAKNRSTSAKRINGVIQTDGVILRNMGFEQVRWASANPPMRKRQLQVNGLLARRKILINPKRCTALKRDLTKVEQDIVSFEKVKSNPELTHASDGMDYLMHFEFPYPKDGNTKAFKMGKI